MRQNIKQNYIKQIDTKLYSGNYFDFMLYKGNLCNQNTNNECIADFSNLNIVNNILYSTCIWSGATNDGIELNNIGLTGVDNGLIYFKKDRITNDEFLDIYLNSKLKIENGDLRLFLSPITGNTQMYSYPMSLVETNDERFISFKGGFYQGFFKIEGENYEVLPSVINKDWSLHFELRPRNDYQIEIDTINYIHPENSGIFFYLGTRAENKFWPFYKPNKELLNTIQKVNAKTEGYFADGLMNDVINLENDWLMTENNICIHDNTCAFSLNEKCSDYFNESYLNEECPKINNNKAFEEDYIGKGIIINPNNLTDSQGHNLNKKGYVDIISNNKFLIFDRTNNGLITDNWVEDTYVKITHRKNLPNNNYFILLNHTKTGYTVDTIESFNETHQQDFNPFKDIINNVFALRITKEGSIGYRYGVLDCNNEYNYSVIEEYSKPNIIKNNEWNLVDVKFKLLTKNKMKILIYVKNNLIFISKELNTFNFKGLNDVKEKQETVPYNISLGGGSLGLLETILPNYYAVSDYILPIEKDFCGSFLGDIKSFKIFNN